MGLRILEYVQSPSVQDSMAPYAVKSCREVLSSRGLETTAHSRAAVAVSVQNYCIFMV